MIFTFTSTDLADDMTADDMTSTTSKSFEADSWIMALSHFMTFLKGSGYNLPDDALLLNAGKLWINGDILMDGSIGVYQPDGTEQ